MNGEIERRTGLRGTGRLAVYNVALGEGQCSQSQAEIERQEALEREMGTVEGAAGGGGGDQERNRFLSCCGGRSEDIATAWRWGGVGDGDSLILGRRERVTGGSDR